MNKGNLYLIPCPLSESQLSWVGKEIVETTNSLKYYLVERAKTARHWLKLMNSNVNLQELQMEEFDKHQIDSGLKEKLKPLFDGQDMGLMSEAGNPCIADPGNLAVKYAHENQINILPLVGPSSFLLALISSGFNGQQFTFHGYLPNKKDELGKKLKLLETTVEKTGYTQMFMEVPYRNHFMLESILSILNPNTSLCIASDIGSLDQRLITKTVKEWKGTDTAYMVKKPAVFILGK